ncbi:MAG: carbamoyltransferase HypF [Promethearchaeota archaeon]
MQISQIIYVRGVVQGVGFRPFVYQIAKKHGLVGNVRNLGDLGVKILISGTPSACKDFLASLKNEKPSLASFTSIDVRPSANSEDLSDFKILPSAKSQKSDSLSTIPPDIGICDSCLEEIFATNNRRYNYSLNSCTYCGPRFSMVVKPPYDRENTTMSEFPLCSECLEEYQNPIDRRFHAQGISCSCGPNISLWDKEGNLITSTDSIAETAKLLAKGNIIAIKGVGGFHLACSSSSDDVVLKLRKRKRKRYTKPFAVMSPNLEAINSFAYISKEEESLLKSYQRPIVLLKKKKDVLSRYIAPDLDTIGVFLPYTGIHSLLLYHYSSEPALIMTSGNASGLPICTSNEAAFSELYSLADYFLVHNRQITQRCDDSVVKFVNNSVKIIRRSRGYVPEQIQFPFVSKYPIIAVGADLKNVCGLLQTDRCTLSQQIGDMSNVRIAEFQRSSLRHLVNLMQCNSIDTITCDLHPTFQTTSIAKELAMKYNASIFPVQHHWAHAASLLIDNKLPQEEIIAIVADGVGYGLDGLPWGGEILKASYSSFERIAHLEPQDMPGGDRCAIYPARFLSGVLAKILPEDQLQEYLISHHTESFEYGTTEINVLLQQLTKKVNTLKTTSLGRILDGVASMLKICNYRSYEGEPAIKLEAFANHKNHSALDFQLPIKETTRKKYEIKTTPLFEYLFPLLIKYSPQELAFVTQKTLAGALAKTAIIAAEDHGVSKIGFSGGVAYNHQITTTIAKILKKEGFIFLQHENIPPGDAGIPVGQLAITSQSLKKGL